MTDAPPARTHDTVLRALVELIEEVGSDDVSYKLIARRAGIGERTIFRYYPTRTELLRAAGSWIEEHVFVPVPFTSLFDVPLAIRSAMDSYDHRPELAHIAAETGMRGGAPSTRCAARIRRAIESELPHVDAAERRHLAAALTHLHSPVTWVTLHRDLGLERADIADAAAWSAESMLNPVRDRGTRAH